jgi:hypothetical protein
MKYSTIIPMLSLQLFAEGAGGTGAGAGDGGTAQGTGVTEAAAGLQKGVKGNLANVKYGIQEDSAPAAEVQTESAAKQDRNAMFEQMIKGEYKDLYDARVQDTVQKRLKGQKEIVDKYHALEPVLEILGRKHGVDASDITALVNAIEADDTYYEDEAMEQGMTVKQLKEFKRLERENANFRAQMEEAQRQEQGKKLYAAWAQQAEDTKKLYPSFDLRAEMNNPRFTDLLKSNIDVRTAYEVLHKDEIIPAAMQFTAQTVESKLAKKIASNGARPAENGMASQSAALVKSDVTQLTKEDRADIIRRVQRGEIIRF